MEDIDTKCAALRAQIAATESQLSALKQELEAAEKLRGETEPTSNDHSQHKWPLSAEEYQRYGRQMIVSQIGLPGKPQITPPFTVWCLIPGISGQLKLRSASVLLVGAGGLGCPAALYLAGAGVGTLGLVDGDTVESSNLHRQVLHRTANVGKFKVDSAIQYLKE
jgi:adenylyltransferase/sulfurtransferase